MSRRPGEQRSSLTSEVHLEDHVPPPPGERSPMTPSRVFTAWSTGIGIATGVLVDDCARSARRRGLGPGHPAPACAVPGAFHRPA